MKCKIVLVPFPFDDLSASKVRPALVLCEPVGHHRHVVLGFITSAIPPRPEDTDIVIEASHPEFAVTGLRGASTIRLHRMMTVTTATIIRELGDVPTDVASKVDDAIRKLFELQ
jgi:mRNA interferase MazF